MCTIVFSIVEIDRNRMQHHKVVEQVHSSLEMSLLLIYGCTLWNFHRPSMERISGQDSKRHPEKMCCICFEVILVEDTVVILPSTDMFRFLWRAAIY